MFKKCCCKGKEAERWWRRERELESHVSLMMGDTSLESGASVFG